MQASKTAVRFKHRPESRIANAPLGWRQQLTRRTKTSSSARLIAGYVDRLCQANIEGTKVITALHTTVQNKDQPIITDHIWHNNIYHLIIPPSAVNKNTPCNTLF